MFLRFAVRAALIAAFASSTSHAATPEPPRSKAEVLFRLGHPCPSTGQTHGACRGYVIDRIVPVICGGADEPDNMQWQTIAEAKEKDRWERIGCRPGRKLVLPAPAVPAEAFALEDSANPVEAQPLSE